MESFLKGWGVVTVFDHLQDLLVMYVLSYKVVFFWIVSAVYNTWAYWQEGAVMHGRFFLSCAGLFLEYQEVEKIRVEGTCKVGTEGTQVWGFGPSWELQFECVDDTARNFGDIQRLSLLQFVEQFEDIWRIIHLD